MNTPLEITIYLVLCLGLIAIMSAIDAYFASKFPRLSPKGRYNPSFKGNFRSAFIRFTIVLAIILILRLFVA